MIGFSNKGLHVKHVSSRHKVVIEGVVSQEGGSWTLS